MHHQTSNLWLLFFLLENQVKDGQMPVLENCFQWPLNRLPFPEPNSALAPTEIFLSLCADTSLCVLPNLMENIDAFWNNQYQLHHIKLESWNNASMSSKASILETHLVYLQEETQRTVHQCSQHSDICTDQHLNKAQSLDMHWIIDTYHNLHCILNIPQYRCCTWLLAPCNHHCNHLDTSSVKIPVM